MPRIPGLRSPHARVGRLAYFGRMLDKIRLNARGALPGEYVANLGETKSFLFDARCCRFLGVPYAELAARTLQGGCDEEILAWAHSRGAARSDEDCLVWSHFLVRIGWRDDRNDALLQRIAAAGLGGAGIQTAAEFLDVDEGRPAGGTRLWETCPVRSVIVMGVAGCGKTTVGLALAAALGWEFIEGDALHSKSNIAKMTAGVPLDDADRAPWLASIRAAAEASAAAGRGTVISCSALKESYRLALAPDPASIRFVHLRLGYDLARSRLAGRSGHYMKESLLQSQYEALEAPVGALTVEAALAPEAIVAEIRRVLSLS